jgi:hypothetical protein
MDRIDKLGLQLQKLLLAIDVKKLFSSVDVSESVPSSERINETPYFFNLVPSSTHTIPDGLIAYSVWNYGNTDILIDSVPLKPGMILEIKQDLSIGNLIGCTVDTQLSEAYVIHKVKN